MIIVGDILVEEEVLEARFACDLAKCHGACCTLKGGRGAPLTDAEAEIIGNVFPIVEKYLPPEHRSVIEQVGMVEGVPGSYATVCVDSRACVFVYYDGPVAKCAFERAHLAGEIPWRKPLSCHLFPLRVRPGTPPLLRYEQIDECDPGRKAGVATDTTLHEFLHGPLERAFGSALPAMMKETARQNLDQ